MGHMNAQMNDLVDGVRVTVKVASYEKAFEGVTWETIAERFEGTQSYGNTKFVDAHIMSILLKNKLVVRRSGVEIGYNHGSCWMHMVRRLKRINVKNVLKIFDGLVYNGLLTKDHMAEPLTMSLKNRPLGRIYRSEVFRYYCKRLVMEALSEALPKGDHPEGKTKVRQVAERLCIPLKTVRFWRDEKVPDIMVYPRE